MSKVKLLRKPAPAKNATATLRSCWQRPLDDHIIALAWSPPAGQWLAAATVSGPIYLIDSEGGEVHRRLPGHGFGTMALAWHPNGSTLASAGQDGKVRLWDVVSGEQTGELAGGAAWVEHVAWLPAHDNRRAPLLAAAAGRTLRIWDESGELVQEYPKHSSTIAHIQWHAPRNELAITSYGLLTVRNPDQPDALRELPWKGSSLVIAWSPDGNYIATGDQDSTVHFWITATGHDLQMWGYPTKVRELAWDHTSRYLATGGSDTVIIWDCGGKGPEGTKPHMLKGHEDTLSVLTYQHKGPLLASGGNDGLVMLWSPLRQKKELCHVARPAPISQLLWLPDDGRLAAGMANGMVELFIV
ncbi:MAG: WD40 repeat domain-containing protein [Caldilinea sp. CFX5]|nr:WD40 repeat domain-containing protein [Caldilinea sp. CFX5]